MGDKNGRGADQYLSLREIGRRLGIPPSTVVYYKDRFERYIPSTHGRGRRKKYPPEALDIFKGIREMYDNSWSAEQIERELAIRVGDIAKAVDRNHEELGRLGVASGQPRELVRTLTEVLDRMSGLLETQALYKGEIDTLKAQVCSLNAELDQRRKQYSASMDKVQAELKNLRVENRQLSDYIHKKIRRGNPLHHKPSKGFMALPLVIRNERGEYLGVASGTKGPFTCTSLVSMVQKSTSASRSVEMDWDRDREHWVLSVQVKDAGESGRQRIIFMLKETVTPSRNVVAQLAHIVVDGREVPERYLLSLFKQIRDSFIS